jgi:pyruvate formate lyase activating enzyme
LNQLNMPTDKQISLKELLSSHTQFGYLYQEVGDGRIECFACGHRCKIGEGKDGICKIRFNRGGKLYIPWGYVSSLALDPIEKKPFFHALPGSSAMSFGMLGCDYHCSFCQNWITSQTLRDPHAVSSIQEISPEDIVSIAYENKAQVVTSTYNEPLITSEWAVEVFKIAKRYQLVTSYVSNGNGTPEVIEYLQPWLDLFKIDLKGFNDKKYRELGGVLQNVLDTIKLAYEKKFWVEIVTLIVPGMNDSEGELKEIAGFIKSVSADIPWHVTAFHSDYKMARVERTPIKTVIRAAEIGIESGLKFVYAGNVPGGRFENTYCPSCNTLLIERSGFRVLKNILKDGCCSKCNEAIAGFWKRPAD